MGFDAWRAGTQIERRKCPARGIVPAMSGKKLLGVSMQDYKSLRAAVRICGTLVNTQTHRQTAFDRLYY